MSLAGLIRKVSPRVPRYIDVDGRVVFVTPGREVVLPDARPKVEPHRFHGGPVATVKSPPDPWWIRNPQRLASEVEDMASAFPGFAFDESTEPQPAWTGTIDTGRGRFVVQIVHHPDAGVLPAVRVLRPRRLGRHEGMRWRRADHLFDNDDLCVAEDRDWNPDRHNAVTMIAWAAHWLSCYTEWRVSGVWPTHGYVPKGY